MVAPNKKSFFTLNENPSLYLFPSQITTGEAYLVHTKRLHSNSQFNQYLSALYKIVGTFLFGGAVSQSLTDLAKFTIGRPRPNFLAVCAPVSCTGYMLHINCTGYSRNVTESSFTSRPGCRGSGRDWSDQHPVLPDSVCCVCGLYTCFRLQTSLERRPGGATAGSSHRCAQCSICVRFLQGATPTLHGT
uniref:Phospholipid phosphatase 2 n=1 Tax=Lates calcarifer TaxID=8187 RepID=A0A4W6DQ70_LATCA